MNVGSEALVGVTAKRVSVCRLLAGESQAIAEHYLVKRKTEWIAGSAITVGESNGAAVKSERIRGAKPKKLPKPPIKILL